MNVDREYETRKNLPPNDIATVLIDQAVCILLHKMIWHTHLLICQELTQHTGLATM